MASGEDEQSSDSFSFDPSFLMLLFLIPMFKDMMSGFSRTQNDAAQGDMYRSQDEQSNDSRSYRTGNGNSTSKFGQYDQQENNANLTTQQELYLAAMERKVLRMDRYG